MFLMEALILSLSQVNKHTLSMGIYQLRYIASCFSLIQVSLYKEQLILLSMCFSSSLTQKSL